MNLEITCLGIQNASVFSNGLDITLEQVSPDFIEQVPAKDIVLYKDNSELLKAMDYDEIVDFLEMEYAVNVVDTSGGVE